MKTAQYVMPFGKYKGERLSAIASTEVGRSYLEWFAENVTDGPARQIVTQYLGNRILAVGGAPKQRGDANSDGRKKVAHLGAKRMGDGPHKGSKLRQIFQTNDGLDYLVRYASDDNSGPSVELVRSYLEQVRRFGKNAMKDRLGAARVRVRDEPCWRRSPLQRQADTGGPSPPFEPGINLMGKPATREQLIAAVGGKAAATILGEG